MKLGHYFNQKTVLITGASSGIGLDLAIELSTLGAHVILCGRNQDRLAKAQLACPGKTTAIVGDLLNPDTLAAIKSCSEQHTLDIAILNAGTNAYIDAHEFDASAANSLMTQNYDTMTHSIEAVLPALLQSKGQLALMSSLAAYGGMTRASAYCASKAAIRAMAQSLDVDLRKRGVSVSCICPGFVKTPLTDKNTFDMPFLMDPKQAASVILKGLKHKRHEIHFPKRFSLPLKLIGSLPAGIQHWLLSRASV